MGHLAGGTRVYQQFGGEFVVNKDGPDQSLDEAGQAAARIAALSVGQLEVLRLVDRHLSSKEIAGQLGISSHTVDQRIRTAIRILGVTRRQEAARLVALAEPYQRLIHQAPYLDPTGQPIDQDGAISFQIRHADRAVGTGDGEVLETEQGAAQPRSSLVLPWSTRSNPRNEMSIGHRLLWIFGIAMGASFSVGMYLAGLESLARLAGH
jgi:DNA-binding CsgD family transcriptional regulator